MDLLFFFETRESLVSELSARTQPGERENAGWLVVGLDVRSISSSS